MASLPSALSQIKLVFTNKVVRNCKDSSALTELNRLCKSSAGMRMKSGNSYLSGVHSLTKSGQRRPKNRNRHVSVHAQDFLKMYPLHGLVLICV